MSAPHDAGAEPYEGMLGEVSPATAASGGAAQRDVAPGDEPAGSDAVARGIRGYLVGLALATLLTALSFALPATTLVWAPGVPIALIAFGIAQMGVHLVFFIHITTAPDNTNNVIALAFGIFIVFLLIGGSVWIMAHLNQNMLPMDQIMRMQR